MLRSLSFGLPLVLLATVAAAPGGPAMLDTQWTKAAQAVAAKGNGNIKLPEIRVYDARGRLVLRSFDGGLPGTIVPRVAAALRSGKAVAGPSLVQTMTALETRDGRAALPRVRAAGRITVVDYWATWCVGCKVVSRELAAWAAAQGGKVLLVRAETDPMKGRAVQHRYFDKDGKELKAD
ncbi:thioredoxin domain-containing protein [Sphingomonas sp.]|uniref:thioredoxin domain-containing protein n=1 Tax=Sphingomonas sp. TaxID=28214 RepID=UPI001B2819A8|nr:thioredoxin domain-containing protein [Sphingomonas sp.]MBO9713805.1 hypothetical protein [Sphingomonas sp.]